MQWRTYDTYEGVINTGRTKFCSVWRISLGKHKRRWDDNMKIYLVEMVWEVSTGSYGGRRDQWPSAFIHSNEPSDSVRGENVFAHFRFISFSTKTLIHYPVSRRVGMT
jgi:hypothetical protein